MQRRFLLRTLVPFAALGGSVLLPACGGGGSGGSPSPAPAAPPVAQPGARTFAFVPNHGSGDISIYQLGDAGELQPVGSVRVPAGAGARSTSIHPSGSFAFTVNELDDSISGYKIVANGMLDPNGTFTAGGAPGEIQIHPSGSFAYVSNLADSTVSVYAIRQDSGTLTAVPPPLQVFATPASIAVHPSGSFVYLARGDNSITSYTVDPQTGGLSFLNFVPTGLSPRKIAVAPSGKFLCGAGADGNVSMNAIDETGALAVRNIVDAGDNATSVVIDPSSRFVYVASTITGVGFRVSTFTIEPHSGQLKPEGTLDKPGTTLSALAIDSSGRFLFATDRAGDSVLAFEIHRDTGALTELAATARTGREPAGITLADFAL